MVNLVASASIRKTSLPGVDRWGPTWAHGPVPDASGWQIDATCVGHDDTERNHPYRRCCACPAGSCRCGGVFHRPYSHAMADTRSLPPARRSSGSATPECAVASTTRRGWRVVPGLEPEISSAIHVLQVRTSKVAGDQVVHGNGLGGLTERHLPRRSVPRSRVNGNHPGHSTRSLYRCPGLAIRLSSGCQAGDS
jgi:hypothetical protein